MDIELAWTKRSEELTKEFVWLDVYDAIQRYPCDRSKFWMLQRVAGMTITNGPTPYQKELRRRLAEVCNGSENAAGVEVSPENGALLALHDTATAKAAG